MAGCQRRCRGWGRLQNRGGRGGPTAYGGIVVPLAKGEVACEGIEAFGREGPGRKALALLFAKSGIAPRFDEVAFRVEERCDTSIMIMERSENLTVKFDSDGGPNVASKSDSEDTEGMTVADLVLFAVVVGNAISGDATVKGVVSKSDFDLPFFDKEKAVQRVITKLKCSGADYVPIVIISELR